MAKKTKGLIINHKTITIRGSFINMLFTMELMGLYVASAANSTVASNVKMIAEPLVATYAISFGVWRTAKYFDDKKEKKECDEKEGE